jgi:hypothetical protein
MAIENQFLIAFALTPFASIATHVDGSKRERIGERVGRRLNGFRVDDRGARIFLMKARQERNGSLEKLDGKESA